MRVSTGGRYSRGASANLQLPAALEEARSSGDFDVATLRTLEEGLAPLRRGGQLSPSRSCALFSTFARKIVGAAEAARVLEALASIR